MTKTVHVVCTDYGDFGWGITSPQLPTLVAGFPTVAEVLERLPRILEFAGVDLERTEVVTHEQKWVQSPAGVEYLLRFLEPSGDGARDELMGRAIASVANGSMDEDLDRMPTVPTGERIVITTEPDDTVGWILDQLADGEGATIEHYGGEDAVYSVPIFDYDHFPMPGKGLYELGITRESTVMQLIDRTTTGEIDDLRKVTMRHLESA